MGRRTCSQPDRFIDSADRACTRPRVVPRADCSELNYRPLHLLPRAPFVTNRHRGSVGYASRKARDPEPPGQFAADVGRQAVPLPVGTRRPGRASVGSQPTKHSELWPEARSRGRAAPALLLWRLDM
jgi:hypothetical protein